MIGKTCVVPTRAVTAVFFRNNHSLGVRTLGRYVSMQESHKDFIPGTLLRIQAWACYICTSSEVPARDTAAGLTSSLSIDSLPTLFPGEFRRA